MSKSKKSASPPSSGSSNFLDAQQLKDVLANKSAADSWHDFHTPISGIRVIIEENEPQYISGLPPGVTSLGSFADEGAALSSVVICPDSSCEYSDYLVGKCKGFSIFFSFSKRLKKSSVLLLVSAINSLVDQ